MSKQSAMTRRHTLAAFGAAGAGILTGLAGTRRAAAAAAIRQGYQTNIWGMPTYYLIKSGYLQKHGLSVEEFAVPSGNITMQQMVAGQVDLGTYAGPSFIIGNVKGGLIAIAVIENVGKTARITTRKDLNIGKVEDLRGRRIANLVGSSVGNDFDDIVMPHYGLHKGDFQEIRMNINDMVAALTAKTVDAMVNVEPYNVIAVANGIGADLLDFHQFDPMPVFMAATAEMVEKRPDAIVAYLKAWLDAANDFKTNRKKVDEVIYSFYASKGYTMSPATFATALSRVEVSPGFPDLKSYMQQQAEILVANRTVRTIPDWSKALRPEFMEKAKAGA
jgi:ABC-type nitrate/sulfonate/bicarbonate transport system substrate-binding protein